MLDTHWPVLWGLENVLASHIHHTITTALFTVTFISPSLLGSLLISSSFISCMFNWTPLYMFYSFCFYSLHCSTAAYIAVHASMHLMLWYAAVYSKTCVSLLPFQTPSCWNSTILPMSPRLLHIVDNANMYCLVHEFILKFSLFWLVRRVSCICIYCAAFEVKYTEGKFYIYVFLLWKWM